MWITGLRCGQNQPRPTTTADLARAMEMAVDKVNEDDVLLATCKYCGTRTRLSFNRAESEKPFICPNCGAPLKVVPRRTKRRRKPPKKMKREYGYDFKLRTREDDDSDGFSRGLMAGYLIVIVSVVVISLVLFFVALISTC